MHEDEVVADGLADGFADFDVELVVVLVGRGAAGRMDLVGLEAGVLAALDLGDEVFEIAVMLRAAVGHDLVAIGAEDAVDGQVDGLAEDVPEAVVDGGGVGELALAAEVGLPLRGEAGKVEDGFAGEGALGVFEPAEVAPVGMEVAVFEGIVAFDAAICNDGSYLFGDGAVAGRRQWQVGGAGRRVRG